MINFRKNIFLKGILILLVTVPFIFVVRSSVICENISTYSEDIKIGKNIESIGNSVIVIPENNAPICDSSTGVCGPPPGW